MTKYYRTLLIVLLILPHSALKAQGGSTPNGSSFRSTSIMRTEPVQSAGTSYRPTGSFRPSSTQYGSTPAVTGHKSPITRPTAAQPVYGSKVMPEQGVSHATGTTGSPRGPRRVYNPGVSEERDGYYYDNEAEDWLPIPGPSGFPSNPSYGDTWMVGAIQYMYNGSDWVPVEAPTEFTPVGDMPWVLMLCAALIYMLVVKYKKNRYEI